MIFSIVFFWRFHRLHLLFRADFLLLLMMIRRFPNIYFSSGKDSMPKRNTLSYYTTHARGTVLPRTLSALLLLVCGRQFSYILASRHCRHAGWSGIEISLISGSLRYCCATSRHEEALRHYSHTFSRARIQNYLWPATDELYRWWYADESRHHAYRLYATLSCRRRAFLPSA